jgi:hypothetical protein
MGMGLLKGLGEAMRVQRGRGLLWFEGREGRGEWRASAAKENIC